jgi:hypothetical protein
MKPDAPTSPDSALHETLQQWVMTETLPPRFAERVWQRIGRRESAAATHGLWARLSEWLTAAAGRRSVAAGYVAVLLLAGSLAGYWHARAETARESQNLGARYVRLLEPFQAHP